MRIGVLCSGGDAPGMNACLRSVVRAATSDGHEVIGIRRGYQGLIDEDFFAGGADSGCMSARSVSHILERGGTVLHSSRCQAFTTPQGLQTAAAALRRNGIDALIPIGGDGTFRGAVALGKVWSGQIIGCPATIDNDLVGTDLTIGFATAVATAVDCIDKLRDTAESHERMFLVEVMGRNSGHLALATALAGSAEIACVPEVNVDADSIAKHVRELRSLGKQSIIIVVAEGDEQGGAVALNQKLAQAGCPYGTRTVILGHVQRGGSPSPPDRILATRLGDFAVRSLAAGATGMMAGDSAGRCRLVTLAETFATHKPLPEHEVELLERMSC
ncbi:6-phosphofructokinase isozyme 1 [Rubripirellula lacrimiformis]|uniref:6-phosphofructokinase n=1 Tax=Rubripirellula lacrimiformis TaxID=1930273 RepID=A0A517N4Q5_9BACT|nr:ATP-dependent 6-phosphofructokinase [Rubripirellula lacrimiformis]QDT02109.1 6-phosphofructokinase isozyme 1 [Rubripirellula lacrimiformis]